MRHDSHTSMLHHYRARNIVADVLYALCYALVFFLAVALTGCETLSTQFENGVYCSLDRTEARIEGKWTTLFGITTKLRERDRAIICK